MMPISANEIKEITRMVGYILLGIWGIKFLICLTQEIFPKCCKHCGRKASGKI